MLNVNTKNLSECPSIFTYYKYLKLLYNNIKTVQQFNLLLLKPLTLTRKIYQNASSILYAKTTYPNHCARC